MQLQRPGPKTRGVLLFAAFVILADDRQSLSGAPGPPTSPLSRASTPTRSYTGPRHSKSSRRTKPKWRGANRRCWRGAIRISSPSAAGIVAGYAYAGPYRDRRAYDWCVEDSIYIAPRISPQRNRPAFAHAPDHRRPKALGFRQMVGGDRRFGADRIDCGACARGLCATSARCGPSASSTAAGSTPC